MRGRNDVTAGPIGEMSGARRIKYGEISPRTEPELTHVAST